MLFILERLLPCIYTMEITQIFKSAIDPVFTAFDPKKSLNGYFRYNL